LITELETTILAATQTIYDAWGWFGVAALLTFENATGVKNAATALQEAGINAVSYVSENTRHEFLTWRRSLYQMAQLLFAEKK